MSMRLHFVVEVQTEETFVIRPPRILLTTNSLLLILRHHEGKSEVY